MLHAQFSEDITPSVRQRFLYRSSFSIYIVDKHIINACRYLKEMHLISAVQRENINSDGNRLFTPCVCGVGVQGDWGILTVVHLLLYTISQTFTIQWKGTATGPMLYKYYLVVELFSAQQ